jgi:hypothetical protein
VADAASRLDRVRFEADITEYVGSSFASELRPRNFQVLFEISDDYVRRCAAVSGMKNQNTFLKDCKSRTKLIAATRGWLADFPTDLNAQALNQAKPVTALLAQSISAAVSKLHSVLEKEFQAIELHKRLSASMLRTLSLKNMRNSYVAHLNSYIEDVILRKLRKKGKSAKTEKLIAGVMSAAKVFSNREKANGIEQSVHMARWRAKKFLKNDFYDRGEFPVFQTRPKKKNNSADITSC